MKPSHIFLSLSLLCAPLSTSLSALAHDAKELETAIENYLFNNPEKLLAALNHMQDYMSQQQARNVIRKLQNELYKDSTDPSAGAATAPIQIVEFFDYNCGYCKRSFEPLMSLLENNKDVRVIFKEFPILSESSSLAARYALSLQNNYPEAYLKFHRALMQHRGAITQEQIDRIITDIGLSPKTIAQNIAAEDTELTAKLETTKGLAEALGVRGTPAFIINNKFIPGALSLTEWQDELNAARTN